MVSNARNVLAKDNVRIVQLSKRGRPALKRAFASTNALRPERQPTLDETRQHHAVLAEIENLRRDAGLRRKPGVHLLGAPIDLCSGPVTGNAQADAPPVEIDPVDAICETEEPR